MALDRAKLARAASAGRVLWREHARRRAEERRFSPEQVLAALTSGEVIEEYATAYPFPAALLLAVAGDRPLHVVAAMAESSEEAYIITVYEPTADKFEADWKTRRRA